MQNRYELRLKSSVMSKGRDIAPNVCPRTPVRAVAWVFKVGSSEQSQEAKT